MRRRLVAALALGVPGIGIVGLALQGVDPSIKANAHGLVNDDRPNTLDAHNSPAAAAYPAQPDLLMVADRIDTPLSSCAVSVSGNGGANWASAAFPLPADAPNCFWPDVTWTEDRTALLLFSATGGPNNQPVGTWVQRIKDQAAPEPAVRVSGPNAFHPRIAADGGQVVATWVQAGPNTAARELGFAPESNPIMVAVSSDGGLTFGAPIRVSEPDRRVAVPSVVVGGNGTVVVSALDFGDDELDYSALHQGRGGASPDGLWHVVTWTSHDSGATFGAASVVADLVIPQRVNVDLGAPRPGLARDSRNGRLYSTWESGPGSARDVYIASSDDQGATWSPAHRVEARKGTQTLPSVDVAPNGRVDVVFYDRSRDPSDIRTEVAQASSWNGGRTFSVATISHRPFDSRIGIGSFQNLPVLGTQTEVVANKNGAVAFWSDTSRATMDDNKQDLAVALVDAHRPRSVRLPLLIVGVAFILGALATGATGRRRRRRPTAI